MDRTTAAAARLCQLTRVRVKEGWLGSTVCHRVVWALARTYGAVYFYNVIIPPPATTLLKLSACWGKNSVKRALLTQTQQSINNGAHTHTHGHTTAHILPPTQLFLFVCRSKSHFGSCTIVRMLCARFLSSQSFLVQT